jgi:hypothetical protein
VAIFKYFFAIFKNKCPNQKISKVATSCRIKQRLGLAAVENGSWSSSSAARWLCRRLGGRNKPPLPNAILNRSRRFKRRLDFFYLFIFDANNMNMHNR